MTFILNNKVKILGSLATLVAGLLSMIALGMFNGSPTEPALLDSITIRWMTIFLSLSNLLLGGGTIAAGVANTTRERVAASEAVVAVAERDVAIAIDNALNTPAPISTGGRQ